MGWDGGTFDAKYLKYIKAGAGFRGPLLIYLLKLTLTVKSASDTLQLVLNYYVFLT